MPRRCHTGGALAPDRYHTGTTPLPRWHHSDTTLVLHWHNTSTALVPRWHHTGTTLVLHCYPAGTTLAPHWYYTGTTLVPHWYYIGITPAPRPIPSTLLLLFPPTPTILSFGDCSISTPLLPGQNGRWKDCIKIDEKTVTCSNGMSETFCLVRGSRIFQYPLRPRTSTNGANTKFRS